MLTTEDVKAVNDLFELIDRDCLDDTSRYGHEDGTLPKRGCFSLSVINTPHWYPPEDDDTASVRIANQTFAVMDAAAKLGFTVSRLERLPGSSDWAHVHLTRGPFQVTYSVNDQFTAKALDQIVEAHA